MTSGLNCTFQTGIQKSGEAPSFEMWSQQGNDCLGEIKGLSRLCFCWSEEAILRIGIGGAQQLYIGVQICPHYAR